MKVVILLPPGKKPVVVSPLGVVLKRGTDKFRLTVNMRYVKRHLGNKVFKFEGLKDLTVFRLGFQPPLEFSQEL